MGTETQIETNFIDIIRNGEKSVVPEGQLVVKSPVIIQDGGTLIIEDRGHLILEG